MRISARCDYACRALLELALHWPSKEPLTLQVVSSRQNIPVRYLVQILIQLKRIGLVSSVRGKAGGYVLAKAPTAISLGQVLRQIGGPLVPMAETAQTKGSLFATIWSEVEGAMAKVLDGVYFEDIMKKARGVEGAINYQI